MADPVKIDYVPRQGRGYTPDLKQQTIGEMWDSFIEFRDVFLGNGFWSTREDDFVSFSFGAAFAGHRVNGAHIFNRIADTSGTVAIQGVFSTESNLIDANGNVLTSLVAPAEIYFESVKNRLYWAGSNNAPKVWDGTTVASWGAAGPTADLGYIALNITDSNTKVQIGTANVTNGSPTVTRVTGTNWVAGTWVGKTIVLDGVEYTILSVGGASTLTLTVNYTGASSPPSVNYQVHYGSRSWTVAPKYAYGYYNPTTGHMTNVSKVLTLSEQQVSNVAVYLTNIATNSTLNGYGYTKIVIFRTAADGSSLLPLKLPSGVGDSNGFLNNTGGPLNLQDEQGDEQLGQILGLFEAPYINNPPPNLKTIAYHDGRFWGIEEARPWILRYSGDSRQIPLGVPEECWPDENFLPISTADGYGVGLKEIGQDLFVTTERFTLIVAGGNGTYGLPRIASRGFGTTQYGIAEHPGDSSEQSASAIYVGRDRRLWRHFAGGRLEELGKPIQELLNSAKKGVRHPYRVHVFPVRQFWMMAVGIASEASVPGTTGYNVLLYDFDQGIWMDWGYFLPEDGMLGTAFVSYVAPDSGDAIFGIMGDQLGGGARYLMYQGGFTKNGVMRTHFNSIGRPDVKKSMQQVVLEVDNPEADYTVTAYYDGLETPYEYHKVVTEGTPRHYQYSQITFVPDHGPKQWHLVSLRVQIPPGQRMYRIQPWFTPESTDDAGKP